MVGSDRYRRRRKGGLGTVQTLPNSMVSWPHEKKKKNFAMGLSDPWSRPEIQSKNYEGFGDAYDDDKYRDLRREWEWER